MTLKTMIATATVVTTLFVSPAQADVGDDFVDLVYTTGQTVGLLEQCGRHENASKADREIRRLIDLLITRDELREKLLDRYNGAQHHISQYDCNSADMRELLLEADQKAASFLENLKQ